MSQAPAMPMFWGDYWSKTRRLSPTQHHAYLFLLGATWMNNCQAFPDDDEVLAGEVGISLKAWKKVRPALVRFFDLSDGTWRNHKLEEVWTQVINRVQKNRENGRLGGRPSGDNQNEKHEENQEPAKPNGSVSVNPKKPIQNQIYKKEDSVGSNEPTAGDAGVVVKLSPRRVTDDDVSESSDRKKTLFEFGRYVFGDKGGGIVTKFLGETRGDIMSACDLIESCRQKDDPRGYAFGILRRREVEDELYRIGEARIYAGAL